ncbi:MULTISPECIES: terminase large subunit domain-containing protein [unclassified Brevundimonas]|nr:MULTISPECIES: terminase large subunit [unclassified Brevundimonas]
MSYSAMVTRWKNGSSGFFNFLDDVKPVVRSSKGGFIPFIPGPRERAEIVKALDGDHSTVVFSWPRRHGKTATSVMIILWRFLTRRTENIAIVANSEKQVVDTAFRALREAFDNTPMLKALASAGTVVVGVDTILFPATSSVIQAYSSNPSALWGKKLTAAQLSELHASKGSAVLEVLTGSLLDSEGSMMLIDSTVGPMSSPLYDLYQAHVAGDDPSLFFSHIQYADLDDACANGPSWIDPVKLRAASRRMLPSTFNLMHLNRWGDASGLLIDADTLSKCTEVSYLADPKAIAAGASYVVSGGLDRAFGGSKHGDSTITTAIAMTVQDDEEHYYVLDSDAVLFSRLGGIKANFRRYHKEWGMSRCGLETYGAQDVYDWAQSEPFADGTELFTPSRKAQYQAFTLMATAAAEGRLHIDPRFTRLIDELRTFEVVDDGKETVGNEAIPKFGHPRGKHDDAVYSLAWAMFATREITLNPYELSGVRCTDTGPARHMCALNGGAVIPMCARSCRSMRRAFDLFDQYAARSPRNNLPIEGFIIDKLKNVGSHTIAR